MDHRVFAAFYDEFTFAFKLIVSLLQCLPFLFDQWLDFLLLEMLVELSERLLVLRYFQVLDLLVSILLQSRFINQTIDVVVFEKLVNRFVE